MLGELRRQPLYWLLLAVPVAAGLEWAHAEALWIFIASGVAIVPLAALMGRATESLAESLGAGIGGLLNATFGNAAELIIALVAMWKGPQMYPLVRASVTGSIIGNVLLVLGLSLALGGIRFRRQTFNRTAASLGATLLALAAVGLIIPTLYFYIFTSGAPHEAADLARIKSISVEIAVILAVIYGLSLVFTLLTHSELYSGTAAETAERHEPEWRARTSLVVLLIATAGVALMSEFLVGSVEQASEKLGMSRVFVGVIVVAIIGNAAEHSTAVLMALKNKVDLSVNIAVGSSIQIALFVAPLLVFASLLLGAPLDLHFTPMETIAVVISIVVLSMVCQDGESHWLEGIMLLAVYAMLAIAFYHLEAPGEPAAVGMLG